MYFLFNIILWFYDEFVYILQDFNQKNEKQLIKEAMTDVNAIMKDWN